MTADCTSTGAVIARAGILGIPFLRTLPAADMGLGTCTVYMYMHDVQGRMYHPRDLVGTSELRALQFDAVRAFCALIAISLAS
jgi:hypothetical protein